MKPGFHCALAWWNPGFTTLIARGLPADRNTRAMT
jgi:hypothetical protein